MAKACAGLLPGPTSQREETPVEKPDLLPRGGVHVQAGAGRGRARARRGPSSPPVRVGLLVASPGSRSKSMLSYP